MRIKNFALATKVIALVATLMLFSCRDNITPQRPHAKKAFTFSNVLKNHRSIKVNITTLNEEQEYIVFISEKKHFLRNQIDTREELLEDDYIYFTEYAEKYEMGLRDFLKKAGWLAKGDKAGYGAVNLYPGTEYVIYCYGVEFNGDFYEATTEICYTEISTTAPELVSVDYDIDVEVSGNVATVTVEPQDYNGYYYTYIIPETDTYYLYENMEFSKDYMAYYRNSLLDYIEEELDLGTALSKLCGRRKSTTKQRLEPNMEHVVLVFTLSDDSTPIIASLPTIKRFNTGDAKVSDLTIDIAVTDITPYNAQLTVTPSNNEESYACVLLGKNQVPNYESDYETMLAVMEHYEPFVTSGVYTEKVYPFMPKSDYVILAFGVEDDLPSTGLFRHDFTTAEADPGKISIESIDLIKLFDVEEIVALNSSYAGKFGESLCVAVVEAKTTAPTDKVYFWWYEDWQKIELSEEAFLEDLLMYDPTTSRTLMDMPYCIFEGEEPFSIFFAGIAEDEDGNLSPIYYGEPFQTSKDMCSPAKEFFDYVNNSSAKRATTHQVIVKL